MGKQKRGQDKDAAPPASGIALAARWPVYEVLLSQGWDEQGALAIVLVARRSLQSERVAAGTFLVDLACLGVKSTQVRLYKNARAYAADMRAHTLSLHPMAPADFNLAAKIVLAGLEYAAALGFKPDPVFAQSRHVLAGANPAACATPVPTGGPEGKPLYVNGPYDDPRRIVEHLMRTVGAGNFHYAIQGSKEDLGLPDTIGDLFEDIPPDQT